MRCVRPALVAAFGFLLLACAGQARSQPAPPPRPPVTVIVVTSFDVPTATPTPRPLPTLVPTRTPTVVPTKVNTPTRVPTAARGQPRPTNAPTPPPAPPGKPALDPNLVAFALQSSGLPISGTQVLTAATDPDKLLGQPGQYSGKVSWQDPRLNNAFGFAELFADEKTLKDREKLLAAAGKEKFVAQAASKALFRLPAGVTLEQAKQYEAAFKKLGG